MNQNQVTITDDHFTTIAKKKNVSPETISAILVDLKKLSELLGTATETSSIAATNSTFTSNVNLNSAVVRTPSPKFNKRGSINIVYPMASTPVDFAKQVNEDIEKFGQICTINGVARIAIRLTEFSARCGFASTNQTVYNRFKSEHHSKGAKNLWFAYLTQFFTCERVNKYCFIFKK